MEVGGDKKFRKSYVKFQMITDWNIRAFPKKESAGELHNQGLVALRPYKTLLFIRKSFFVSTW